VRSVKKDIAIRVADRCLRQDANVTWDDLPPHSKRKIRQIIRSEVWRDFIKGRGSYRSDILPLFHRYGIRYYCDGQEVDFDYDALLSLFRSFGHDMSFR
jgi:hypothetical protein